MYSTWKAVLVGVLAFGLRAEALELHIEWAVDLQSKAEMKPVERTSSQLGSTIPLPPVMIERTLNGPVRELKLPLDHMVRVLELTGDHYRTTLSPVLERTLIRRGGAGHAWLVDGTLDHAALALDQPDPLGPVLGIEAPVVGFAQLSKRSVVLSEGRLYSLEASLEPRRFLPEVNHARRVQLNSDRTRLLIEEVREGTNAPKEFRLVASDEAGAVVGASDWIPAVEHGFMLLGDGSAAIVWIRVTSGAAREVFVHDLKRGSRSAFPGATERIRRVAVSPDGRHLAVLEEEVSTEKVEIEMYEFTRGALLLIDEYELGLESQSHSRLSVTLGGTLVALMLAGAGPSPGADEVVVFSPEQRSGARLSLDRSFSHGMIARGEFGFLVGAVEDVRFFEPVATGSRLIAIRAN